MKNFNNKIGVVFGTLALGILAQACLKPNKGTYTDFSTVQDHVIIMNSGLANLPKAPASIVVAAAESDTIEVPIEIQLASKSTNAADLTVTLGIDDAKRTEYNTKNGKNFLIFPDSIYSFPTRTVTVKAGQNFAKTSIMVYKPKVDPSKSYMLPISIKDASGKNLTSNFNTQYFNIIGNPFAGTYLWTFKRYNAADSNVALNGLSFADEAGLILPISETEFTMKSGYYIEPRYLVSFKDNGGGSYSDFKAEGFNEDDLASMEAGGVTVSVQPKVWIADPVAKRFVLNYTAFNGSASRYIIDDYHQ
jgi:hypothetical protein